PVGTGPVPDAQGTGHGLTGMRERAHAVGGSFRAGADTDGRFRVDVRLPLPEAETPADAPSGAAAEPDATTPQGRPA
ncbi:hypothetical protein ACTWQO_43925, partial [Streptomyces sp. 4N124]